MTIAGNSLRPGTEKLPVKRYLTYQELLNDKDI